MSLPLTIILLVASSILGYSIGLRTEKRAWRKVLADVLQEQDPGPKDDPARAALQAVFWRRKMLDSLK